MKKQFLFLFTLIFILFSQLCYAGNEITADIIWDGNKVTVSGKVKNSTGPQTVILLIGNPDNVLHTQQIMSEEDGSFVFDAVMPEGTEYGEYPYMIATPALLGKIDYSSPETKEISTEVAVDGNEVVFTGKLMGVTGAHEVTIMVGSLDNIMYLNQTTSETDGSFEFKATMPKTALSGEYPYTIGTSAGIPTLFGTFDYTNDNTKKEIIADVTISGNKVTFTGNLVGVEGLHGVTLLVGGLDNIMYLNQTTSEADGSFEFKATMPDTALSGEYPYTIGTSADIPTLSDTFDYAAPLPGNKYMDIKNFEVSNNMPLPYFVQTEAMDNINNKTIVVEYPSELLTLSDACLFTSTKEISPVNLEQLGINIKSVSPGRIEFEVANNFIDNHPVRMVVTGMNFVGCSNGMAEIKCSIVDKEGN